MNNEAVEVVCDSIMIYPNCMEMEKIYPATIHRKKFYYQKIDDNIITVWQEKKRLGSLS